MTSRYDALASLGDVCQDIAILESKLARLVEEKRQKREYLHTLGMTDAEIDRWLG